MELEADDGGVAASGAPWAVLPCGTRGSRAAYCTQNRSMQVSRLGLVVLLAAALAALLVITGMMGAPPGFGSAIFAVAAFLFLFFPVAEIFSKKQ